MISDRIIAIYPINRRKMPKNAIVSLSVDFYRSTLRDQAKD